MRPATGIPTASSPLASAETTTAGTTTPTPTTAPTTAPTPAPTTAPTTAGTTGREQAAATVAGVDVSAYQRSVDWAGLWASGHRFVWVKATEGSTWTSPRYAAQVAGAREVGFLVGAYHYARPGNSAAAVQARHLVSVSGGWTPDGRTLPGALDLEFAESGEKCHGLSPSRMTAWVADFVAEYRRLTGRAPLIYTTREFWTQCLSDDRTIPAAAPLWLFDHEGDMGPWPAGWQRPTVWQRGVDGGIDRNVFLGSAADLVRFATTG